MNELKTKEDLEYTPMLRALLINYISCIHEDASDYTIESIWNEYKWLKDNNKLDLLFQQEYLDSHLHWSETVI
jgi:hypothetical protein